MSKRNGVILVLLLVIFGTIWWVFNLSKETPHNDLAETAAENSDFDGQNGGIGVEAGGVC